MPLQTRSAAAASSEKTKTRSGDTGTSSGRGRSPLRSETDNKSQTVREAIAVKRESPVDGPVRDEHPYASPRARSREHPRDASASRHRDASPESPHRRRDWHRGRTMRLPPSGSQEHIFSPPPYQTDRYQHPQQHELSHPMEYGDRRDYDLDLGEVSNEEMMVPDVEDPLLFGTFTESPPRPGRRSPEMDQGSERKRSAQANQSRRSPPYYSHPAAAYTPSHYRRSPRSSSSQPYPQPPPSYESHPPQHHPPPMYHYGAYPPPHHSSPPHPMQNYPRQSPGSGMKGGYYHGYPPYYHYPPQHSEHWDPRQPSAYPQSFETDEDQIPPPPSSGKKRPNPSLMDQSPPSPGRGTGQTSTPKKEIKRASPFRSPPTSGAKNKFKRSPFYSAASPHIGTYGSFGMDTPRATLGSEFSPMGPEFSTFTDEATPLPLGDENYKLSISRSASAESDTPVLDRRPPKDPASPLTGFMRELSPLESGIQGVPRSPLRHTNIFAGDQPLGSRDRANPQPKGAVTMSGGRGSHNSRILGSPMESTGGAKPRKLWPSGGGGAPSSATPSHQAVRVELGGTSSSTRKSLEGINTMLQARDSSRRDSTPTNRVGYGARSQQAPPPQHHHHPPPPGRGYRGEIATPIKPVGHPANQRMTPQSVRAPYPQPHGSATKSVYPGSAQKAGYPPGSSHKTGYDPPRPTYPGSSQKPGSTQKIPPSAGKENKKKSPGSKRSPCNCKKSKCLKLYCECFAAERFCQGCNCVDCGNTANAGQMREKAIKDTRAKNPNAFKPRIGVKHEVTGTSPQSGHNMGCRCKRSECLKKYCECFQAGVICGTKCKCVDCLNYAGSQALIDKRRKIKDQRGADFAMRVADEAWKGQPGSSRKPSAPPSGRRIAPPLPSPAGGRLPPPPHMMHPSPRGQPPPGGPHHHPYMPHQGMMMGPQMGGPMGPMGFSPMGIPMTPAGYPKPPPMPPSEPPHGMYPPPPGNRGSSRQVGPQPPQKIPPTATPRTPGVRVKFDPASSRKKRKLSPGASEPTYPYFGGNLPEQPKTTALAIFSFLSNDELYNAGLVCKNWSRLAMDEELWKFVS